MDTPSDEAADLLRALTESELRYRRLVEISPFAIVVSREGRIAFANSAAVQLFAAHTAGDLLGKATHDLIHPDYLEVVRERTRLVLDGQTVPPLEEKIVRLDGTEAFAEVAAAPFQDQGALAIQVVFRDITHRKKNEEHQAALTAEILQKNDELSRSLSQLQALTERLQTVREEEATRIAREIHDELGQLLTAMKMDVSWLRKREEAVDVRERAAFRERTRAISELIDRTITSVQRIAEELRPGALDHLGLAAAIEREARELERRSGVASVFEVSPMRSDIPQRVATAAFRIFQELTTNVARHAAANRVSILLSEAEGELRLVVRDDGRGISEESLTATSSLGLIGIRERALAAGGQVTFDGRTGQGTTVSVRLPLPGVPS